MTQIKEKTAIKAWKKILDHVLREGREFIDRRDNLCKESLNVVATVESVENVLKPIKILNMFNKWIYPSPEQIKESILGNDPHSSEYYYNYGERAFSFNGLNQIDSYIIPLLKKNPNSKRAIVVFFNPEKDIADNKKEIPGLVMMNFNIRDGKINTTMVIRSNDMFHGWPANIAQAYFITEYLSKELNYPIGDLTTVSVSAHIFEGQFEDIGKVVGR